MINCRPNQTNIIRPHSVLQRSNQKWKPYKICGDTSRHDHTPRRWKFCALTHMSWNNMARIRARYRAQGVSVHRRNRTFKPSIGPMLGQYKRPDWASANAITSGPLQARLQLGQYKRLLELAHIKWLDLAQVQQIRRAFFSTNWLVSSLLRHGYRMLVVSTDMTSFNFNGIEMT